MPKYYVHMTVNSPRGETDYKLELDDLNLAIDQVKQLHPSATSVVMSIVPNRDGANINFGSL